MAHLVELGNPWGSDGGGAEAIDFLPLLESICREIADRLAALKELEKVRGRPRGIREQIAAHRAALDAAYAELGLLGCGLSTTDPLTIVIMDEDGLKHRSFVWEAEGHALPG